ncbi:MAG: type II secretion system protein [Candidatus Methylacidiphilales bacterium]|nr:type II secretion system protein [Candidatus Methylacidiphilales bacterium]
MKSERGIANSGSSGITSGPRCPCRTSFPPSAIRRPSSAFTLIELLVVVGIIAILLALTIPSITGLAGSAGRKGAVNVLLNTFEQARAYALEGSVNTYVGFADKNFPEEAMRYRAFIVFREKTDDDPAGTGEYVPLTKWETLPKTISFKSENQSLLADYYLALTDTSVPRLSSGAQLPVLAFNPSGAIQSLHTTARLRVFLYEGYFLNNQDNFVRQAAFQRSSSGLFECITFSRFTGRAQVDVTTTQ